MIRRLLGMAVLLSAFAACDRAGNESGLGQARPNVAPPKLSPVELLPPTVDRSVTQRIDVRNPPAIAAIQIDVFQQPAGKADILWAVDDSGTMVLALQRLAGNFTKFFQELSDAQTDFQMAVISTNPIDQGVFRGTTPIITNNTPDAGAVFSANTTFPTGRIRWAAGLRMVELALSSPDIDGPDGGSGPGPNFGFLRPGAALAVIVATKKDDQSLGDPRHYARFLRHVKGEGNEKLVTFSTIGGTSPNGCIGPGEQGYFLALAEPAVRYDEVSTFTGGVTGSICDASFETTLQQIAEALNTLRRIFPLSLTANVSTVTVTVLSKGVTTTIPEDPINGWQYRADTNTIAFFGTYVPPPNSTVTIEYAIN